MNENKEGRNRFKKIKIKKRMKIEDDEKGICVTNYDAIVVQVNSNTTSSCYQAILSGVLVITPLEIAINIPPHTQLHPSSTFRSLC